MGTTLLFPYMLVPRLVCAQTHLCQDMFVPMCPNTFAPRHVCAQTRLCPYMTVFTHDCAHMIVHIHYCAHIHNNNNSGNNHTRAAIF